MERRRKAENLRDLEKQIAEIEEKRQALLEDATRFRAAGPEQVLDFFLRESETTRSFEGSLGVVSRVRLAFEQLDAIFKEAGKDNKLRPANARFDRIVLYIDDLDRCRAQQVVEVLEAVHLLLAFPLFVVVVGVDARWLEQSLLEFYKEKLRSVNDIASKDVEHDSATVHDFLEKIFQIPVRLRRLSALPASTFAGFVREAAGPVRFAEDQGEESRQRQNGDGRTEIAPLDVGIVPVEHPAGAVADELPLTRPEVEMIEELGPIVGKTPRAVKRFVNLYRLVRGMRRGPELDAFLAQETKGKRVSATKPYAAYQFWLAIEVGQPLEQARRLRSVVGKLQGSKMAASALLDPKTMPADLRSEIDAKVSKNTRATRPSYSDEIEVFWTSVPPAMRKSVYDALNFAMTRLQGTDGTQILKTALQETRRFSSDRL